MVQEVTKWREVTQEVALLETHQRETEQELTRLRKVREETATELLLFFERRHGTKMDELLYDELLYGEDGLLTTRRPVPSGVHLVTNVLVNLTNSPVKSGGSKVFRLPLHLCLSRTAPRTHLHVSPLWDKAMA